MSVKTAAESRTTKRPPTTTTTPSERTPPLPTFETVQRKAYELFTKRGFEPGHDMEDWFTAERMLKAKTR